MRKDFVILGGWARVASTYQKTIETAPDNSHVYCIDHTSIIPGTKIPSMEEIHFNISKELEKIHLSSFVLIGHSLGGALALSFASKYPENIQKLILVDSEGIPHKERFIKAILHLLENNIFHHWQTKAIENIKAFFRVLSKFPLYIAAGRYSYNIELYKEAQEIKVPTILLWGEKDKVTPVQNSKVLHQLIPSSKLIILSEMDHDWLIHYPEGLWKNINQ